MIGKSMIGEYASLHGNKVAICHSFKQLDIEVKFTSVYI